MLSNALSFETSGDWVDACGLGVKMSALLTLCEPVLMECLSGDTF